MEEILTERTYVYWVQQWDSLVRSLPIEAELSKSWANWVSEPFESMTQTATEALSRGRRRPRGRWRSRASVRSHGSLRRNFAPRRQRRATVRLACFLWRYLLPLRSLSRGEAPFTSVVYHYGQFYPAEYCPKIMLIFFSIKVNSDAWPLHFLQEMINFWYFGYGTCWFENWVISACTHFSIKIIFSPTGDPIFNSDKLKDMRHPQIISLFTQKL